MQLENLMNAIQNLCDSARAWLSDLFNFDPKNRSRQLIPIRHEQSKPARNMNHQDYESNLIKLLFIIATTLLLFFFGAKLLFDH